MSNSIWMGPWDVIGEAPDAVAGRLRRLGLGGVRLAYAYHGGRLLLPKGNGRLVYELDPSAAYFAIDPDRYGRLRPHVAEAASLTRPFAEACRKAGLDVLAWTVLCHNDRLGAEHPDVCVQNVFGEHYPYALCPSHPDVRHYAVALCADVAAQPDVGVIDLEACSFMGYSHGGLHDKRGVTLPRWVRWLLSVCVCPHCTEALGPVAEPLGRAARRAIRDHLADPSEEDVPLQEKLEAVLGTDVLKVTLETRRDIVRSLLGEIRAATPDVRLDLRLAPDPLFVGGKSALAWADLDGRADAATLTFFGYSENEMASTLSTLPPPDERPVPVHGGFVIHGPDVQGEADVARRLALLDSARLDGRAFYSYSLATEPHLARLAHALRTCERVNV